MGREERRARRKRHRFRRWLTGIVVFLAVLWVGYWFAVQAVAGRVIERVTAGFAANDQTVSCQAPWMGGFPLRLDVDCQGGKIDLARSGLSGGITRVSASAPLYAPGSVNAVAAGPLVLNAPDRGIALTASWQRAALALNAGLSGLNSGDIALDKLVVEQTGQSLDLPFRRLTAASGALAANPANAGDYRIDFAFRDIVMEKPGGLVLPAFGAEGSLIAIDVGSSLGLDPRATLQRWIAKGGAVNVDRLTLSLGPDTHADVKGVLTLSPAGLLNGQVTLAITGLDAIPGLAETFQPGASQRVGQVIGAVSAFTRAAIGSDGKERREINLTIRDGTVRAGLIPLARIPALPLANS
jgi:hypothetical protein